MAAILAALVVAGLGLRLEAPGGVDAVLAAAGDVRALAVLRGHTAEVTGVAFARDGRTLVSASWDGSIRLSDARTRKRLGALHGHDGFVLGVALRPDGRTLASASADRTVRLWDVTATVASTSPRP